MVKCPRKHVLENFYFEEVDFLSPFILIPQEYVYAFQEFTEFGGSKQYI